MFSSKAAITAQPSDKKDDLILAEYKQANQRIKKINLLGAAQHHAKCVKERLTGWAAVVYEEAGQLKARTEDLKKFDESFLDSKEITEHVALKNLWKLGVDGKDHDRGRLAYDQGKNTLEIAENGYIDAMETALAFMFKTLDEDLTPQLIQQLHFLCCCNVSLDTGYKYTQKYMNPAAGSHLSSGRLRLVRENVTKEGLAEMAGYDFFHAWVYKKDGTPLELTPATVDEFFQLVQTGSFSEGGLKRDIDLNWENETLFAKIISAYTQDIKKAVTDDEKILTIATLAKKIEIGHFFSDGNLRMVRLIILKLLMQNKLPLTCMLDPNIIDGHSSIQIAEAIKQGMGIYQRIKPTSLPATPGLFTLIRGTIVLAAATKLTAGAAPMS